jgi:hypothetical protein
VTVAISAAGTIVLQGQCSSEDAETLVHKLLTHSGATVDWRGCRGAHTAVIQVLLAARPPLLGPPADTLLRDWVLPLLTQVDGVK